MTNNITSTNHSDVACSRGQNPAPTPCKARGIFISWESGARSNVHWVRVASRKARYIQHAGSSHRDPAGQRAGVRAKREPIARTVTLAVSEQTASFHTDLTYYANQQ